MHSNCTPAFAPAAAALGQPAGTQEPLSLQQQQPTVATSVVASIATTDFSSVAGLGELLPTVICCSLLLLSAAAVCCCLQVRAQWVQFSQERRCWCPSAGVESQSESRPARTVLDRRHSPVALVAHLPTCMNLLSHRPQMTWCVSCGRWYCCPCSILTSLRAWASARHGELVPEPIPAALHAWQGAHASLC